MSRPFQLNDLLSRGEPQLLYNWYISFTPLEDGSRLPGMFVQDTDIPINRIDANPYHQNGTKRYDPGFSDVDGINMTFYENIRGQVFNYLWKWKKYVLDDDGFYGRPSDYKRSADIVYHDQKGEPVTSFTAQGIWPTHISTIQASSSDNNALFITCAFSCDNMVVNTSSRTTDSISSAQSPNQTQTARAANTSGTFASLADDTSIFANPRTVRIRSTSEVNGVFQTSYSERRIVS